MSGDLATNREREERRFARELDQRSGLWDGEHPLSCDCPRCQTDEYDPAVDGR